MTLVVHRPHPVAHARPGARLRVEVCGHGPAVREQTPVQAPVHGPRYLVVGHRAPVEGADVGPGDGGDPLVSADLSGRQPRLAGTGRLPYDRLVIVVVVVVVVRAVPGVGGVLGGAGHFGRGGEFHVCGAAVDAHRVVLRVLDGGGDRAGGAGGDGQGLPLPAVPGLIDFLRRKLPDVPDPGPFAVGGVGVKVEAALAGGVIGGRALRQSGHCHLGGRDGVRAVVHGDDAEGPLARRQRRGPPVPHLQLRHGADVEGVGAGVLLYNRI